MNVNFRKNLAIIFIFLIAVLLEFKLKMELGWSFDLVLAVLLVAPLFLDLSGLLFFIGFSFFIFRILYPFSGFEAALLIVLPIFSFIFKNLIIWQSWIEPFVILVSGITIFYAATNFRQLSANLGFFAMDMVICLAFGLAINLVLAKSYK